MKYKIENQQLFPMEVYEEGESPAVFLAQKLWNALKRYRPLIFPSEREAFLIPLITFFKESEGSLRQVPPRVIAMLALELADFRKHNVKEEYLTVEQLSREVQKVTRRLAGDK